MISLLLLSIIRMTTKIMRCQLFLKATLMLEATRVVMRLSLRQNAEESLHLFKLGKIYSWITKLIHPHTQNAIPLNGMGLREPR